MVSEVIEELAVARHCLISNQMNEIQTRAAVHAAFNP